MKNLNFITDQAIRMVKKGDIDLLTDDMSVHFIYEPKPFERTQLIADKSFKSLSDINHHLVTKEGVLLKGKTYKDGVFDADNTFFPTIGIGEENHVITAIAITHVKTGTLFAIIFVPFPEQRFSFNNGGDIWITWFNGPNKIFNIKKDLEEIVL